MLDAVHLHDEGDLGISDPEQAQINQESDDGLSAGEKTVDADTAALASLRLMLGPSEVVGATESELADGEDEGDDAEAELFLEGEDSAAIEGYSSRR